MVILDVLNRPFWGISPVRWFSKRFKVLRNAKLVSWWWITPIKWFQDKSKDCDISQEWWDRSGKPSKLSNDLWNLSVKSVAWQINECVFQFPSQLMRQMLNNTSNRTVPRNGKHHTPSQSTWYYEIIELTNSLWNRCWRDPRSPT